MIYYPLSDAIEQLCNWLFAPRLISICDRISFRYHGRIMRTEIVKMTGRPHPSGLPDTPLNSLQRRILSLATNILESLRSCAYCHGSNDQEDFIVLCSRYGDFPVHVDCGAEYNDAHSVDETTPYLGEPDEAWRFRCRNLGY